MEKKEYKAPNIIVYGDVKEITKVGGSDYVTVDRTWIGDDGKSYASFKGPAS